MISTLSPTEAKLLLKPYKLKERDLILEVIRDLFYAKTLSVTKHRFGYEEKQVIGLTDTQLSPKASDYQRLVISRVKDHYKYYASPIDEESTLTPDKLLRSVYGTVNHSYPKFKRKYILKALVDKGLCHTTFPFYYLRQIYTAKGKEVKARLIHLINEIETYHFYYLKEEPEKFKQIAIELGPCITLASNFTSIKMNVQSLKRIGLFTDEKDSAVAEVIDMAATALDMTTYELPSLELPSFELPDIDSSFFGDS